LVKLLKQQQASGKAMVAAAYDEKMGTPAIFSKQVFDKLFELEGDTGARKLIKQYPNDVASIAFEAGRVDIDTEADYKTLMMQKQPVS
jgi:molybdenum cofactor cytidylyltransferase